MKFIRSFGRVFAFIAAGSCLAFAQTNLAPKEPENASWLERLLKTPIPKFRTYVPALISSVYSTSVYSTSVYSNCSIAPLSPVDEPRALLFESNSISTVDTSGLTAATANALIRLQVLVARIGGHLELKSAYRPLAYQEHLQEVWDKARSLRRSRESGCQALRKEVTAEFTRHSLLVTQRPVTDSDHTRGVGIDASLVLPRGARVNRRRTSLDRLAKMVGFARPDIRHDPVHFRLLAEYRTDPTATTADGTNE